VTFAEMKARAAELCTIEGYADASTAPDWGRLVNLAYARMVWEAAARRGTESVISVANQREYVLPAPEFKVLFDCWYGDYALQLSSEASVRRSDPYWLRRKGHPAYYWMDENNQLKLHPTPDTSGVVICVYGPRLPNDLTADNHVPVYIPSLYHESICHKAYCLHASLYARSPDQVDALMRYTAQYEAAVLDVKKYLASTSHLGSETQLREPAYHLVQP
jgi:hypothetical protein